MFRGSVSVQFRLYVWGTEYLPITFLKLYIPNWSFCSSFLPSIFFWKRKFSVGLLIPFKKSDFLNWSICCCFFLLKKWLEENNVCRAEYFGKLCFFSLPKKCLEEENVCRAEYLPIMVNLLKPPPSHLYKWPGRIPTKYIKPLEHFGSLYIFLLSIVLDNI